MGSQFLQFLQVVARTEQQSLHQWEVICVPKMLLTVPSQLGHLKPVGEREQRENVVG